jgi:hypothetical protein
MKIILIATIIMLSSVSFAQSIELPKDWRIPNSTDVYHPDNDRSINKYQYLKVLADFNGDKIIDTAYLLINDKTKKMGLFVYISKGTSYVLLKLYETENSYINNMGISLVLPGKYKTACGKGYWECAKAEPAVLDIKLPAINYFIFESANSYWYWNKSSQSFKEVTISD